ncbi:MAG: clostripain-related cysteine peptidase [Candidatus Brocadiales bacterium]
MRLNGLIPFIILLILCTFYTEGLCAEGRRPLAKWTCILYLAGDNFLDWFTLQNLDELRGIGSNYDVRVVVLVDRTDKRGHLYEVRKDYLVSLPMEAVRPEWKDKELNTGDPDTLSTFASWAVESLPAENYFILLGGYGEGWMGMLHDMDDGGGKVDILGIDEMEEALSEITKSIKKTNGKDSIDILGLDACFMGMVEVLYQIGDSARYVIVSENEEALDGWPYDKVIEAFVQNSTRPARELAASVVDAYVGPVQDEKAVKMDNVRTASLIDMEGFKGLIPLLEELALELSDLLPAEIINIIETDRLTNTFTVSAHIAGRYVPYSVHYDLGEFLKALTIRFTNKYPALCTRVEDAMQALDGAVIKERHQDLVGRRLSLSGLTIYSMGAELEAYSKLPFSLKTGWNEFVEAKLKPLEKAMGKGAGKVD